MPFYISDHSSIFPHPYLADDNGLLAISHDLNTNLILLAYQFGIFPWSNQDEPVLWWFTHPRCVLYPEKIKISKSMRKLIKSQTHQCTFNQNFSDVIDNCQKIKREGQGDTWITTKLKQCFIELHHQGFAHSVEVWNGQELVGGLYGLAIGKVFYGESMFAKVSNASKLALIFLSQKLYELDFRLIDCQQETDHLKSMGAELISPKNFLDVLRSNIFVPPKTLATSLSKI